MKISGEIKGGALLLSLSGELDHHGAKEVMSSVAEIINEHVPRSCVMDFKDVGFMDSSGIGFIMGRFSLAKKLGGELVMVDPSPRVSKILSLAGMERIIKTERKKK